MTIKEKELELLICRNPHCILSRDAIILGRQVPLVHGRADILAWEDGVTYVIELKVAPLQEKDVGQVLRYTRDVTDYLFIAFDSAIRQDDLFHLETWRGDEYAHLLKSYANAGLEQYPVIRPMLIGPSASDSVMAAASSADIDVITWTDNGKRKIRFSHAIEKRPIYELGDHVPDWAKQVVSLSQDLAKKYANSTIDHAIKKLFAETQP